MAVTFKMDTIYRYAFSKANELEDVKVLSHSEIDKFKKCLEENIVKHPDGDYRYRLVCFKDQNDVFAYNQDYSDFLITDDGIELVSILEYDLAEQIEETYNNPIVTEALRKARASIRPLRKEPITLSKRREIYLLSVVDNAILENEQRIMELENEIKELKSLKKDYENLINTREEIVYNSKQMMDIEAKVKTLTKK